MPNCNIRLSEINESLQIGDIVYYIDSTDLTTVASFETSSDLNNIIKIGDVVSIDYEENIIVVNSSADIAPPTANDYLLFSKDNAVNISGIVGYYAKVRFINTSKTEAELFSVGLETFQSSK